MRLLKVVLMLLAAICMIGGDSLPYNPPITALCSGTVVEVPQGNRVDIAHTCVKENMIILYGHLFGDSPECIQVLVKKGDAVQTGTPLYKTCD